MALRSMASHIRILEHLSILNKTVRRCKTLKRTFYLLIIVCSVLFNQVYAICPECYKDYIYPKHLVNPDGTERRDPSDYRNVITWRIDGSWDVDNKGNKTPGHTNDNIWNAVNAAFNNWNNISNSFYHFTREQQNCCTVITVIRQDVIRWVRSIYSPP